MQTNYSVTQMKTRFSGLDTRLVVRCLVCRLACLVYFGRHNIVEKRQFLSSNRYTGIVCIVFFSPTNKHSRFESVVSIRCHDYNYLLCFFLFGRVR